MRRLVPVVLLLGVSACAPPPRTTSHPPPDAAPPNPAAPPVRPVLVGTASWYGAFHHGRRTASGEVFDMNALTAAHRTMPLGTRVRVTNLSNGRSVEVRVNDRGPFVPGRIIDLSRAAAAALDAVEAGVFPVEIVEVARRLGRALTATPARFVPPRTRATPPAGRHAMPARRRSRGGAAAPR